MSKLSTISTTASENQTIHGTVPPEEVAGPSGLTAEERVEVDVPMEVEQLEPEPFVPPFVPVPVPVLEPIPEPILESLPEPMSKPLPEPVHEPEPELTLEAEPVLELAPEPEPVSMSEPEPVPPELQAEPEPGLVSVPVPVPPPEAREEETQLAARIAAIPRDRYTNIIAVGGKIIIEELDTPATRREKASRRKAEKRAAAAAAAAAAVQPSTRDKGNGHESDLSSLSELESEEEGGGEARRKERQSEKAPPPVPPVAGPSTPQPAEPGVVVLPEGKTLEGGTLGACSPVMAIYILIKISSSLG